MNTHFHLFVYGTLCSGRSNAHMLHDCELVGPATVPGTLYDIEGRHPALVLAGPGLVHGEVWRCPAGRLLDLDRFEGVGESLFRRVAVKVDDLGCWTYVAGPALARLLRPEARIEAGVWVG